MSTESKGLTILKENVPTLEALIRMNSPTGISESTIKAKALEELSHFQMLSLQKPEILDCEPLSILLAVKQVIKQNLSLDPSQGLVYTMVGSVKNKAGQYIKVLETPETANGKISVARQCGRILDIKRPQISYNDNGQCIKVVVEFLVPSIPSPRWEVIEFTEHNFKKWQKASHVKNSRGYRQDSGKAAPDAEKMNYSNALYKSWNGGIDPEFAATKAIRHGLNKLGTNINEMAGPKIVYKKEEPIISPEAANKESSENHEGEDVKYTQFEEVSSIPNPNLPNTEDL